MGGVGHAGQGAGEPGPASGVAASASGTQGGPGLGGPPPQAAPGPACGFPPGPFQGREDKDKREWEDRKEEELGGRKRDGGAESADQQSQLES